MYEWYVTYAEIKLKLEEDMKKVAVSGDHSCLRILVAGCGNSTLCEDLANDGLHV